MATIVVATLKQKSSQQTIILVQVTTLFYSSRMCIAICPRDGENKVRSGLVCTLLMEGF